MLILTSFILVSPNSSKPTTKKPSFDNVVNVEDRFVTSIKSTNSSAPEAAFASEPVSPGLCFFVVIIDLAPKTFADLIIAPMF